jgi:hypothetical protein
VGGYEENVEITFSGLGCRVEFKIFADVSGGHATSSSGSGNFKKMFSQNIIFLVTLICVRIFSLSKEVSARI